MAYRYIKRVLLRNWKKKKQIVRPTALLMHGFIDVTIIATVTASTTAR